MVFFGIFNLILILLGMISAVWTIIGVPLGIYFLLKYLTTKNTGYKKKLPKRILLSFLGLILMIMVPVLWALLNILGVSSGAHPLYTESPGGFIPLD